jgi:hypothetical protein
MGDGDSEREESTVKLMNWRILNKNTVNRTNRIFIEFYKTAGALLYPFFALFSFK